MSGSFAPLNFGQFQAPDLVGMSNAAQAQSLNAMREQQLMGAEKENMDLRRLVADPNFDPTAPSAMNRILSVAPRSGAQTYQALMAAQRERRQAEGAGIENAAKLTLAFRNMLPAVNAENYPTVRAAAVAAVPQWAAVWPETYSADAVRGLMEKAEDSLKQYGVNVTALPGGQGFVAAPQVMPRGAAPLQGPTFIPAESIPAAPASPGAPGPRAEAPGLTPAQLQAAHMLRGFEGFEGTPYFDRTAFRAGFGSDTTTLADGTVVPVRQGMTVNREDAERDLARRVPEFTQRAERNIGAENFARLPPNAQAALISIAYNYGHIPESLLPAARSGDLTALSQAVAALPANPSRRQSEAAVIAGQGPRLVQANAMAPNAAPANAMLAPDAAAMTGVPQLPTFAPPRTLAEADYQKRILDAVAELEKKRIEAERARTARREDAPAVAAEAGQTAEATARGQSVVRREDQPLRVQEAGQTVSAQEAARIQVREAEARRAETEKLNTAISELERISRPGGLLERSTGGGLNAILDSVFDFFNAPTPGAVAIGSLAPIADIVLKMVPRFEGPQSDKDTATYQNAAGRLADPTVPNETRLAAAREILRLFKDRRNQFSYSADGAAASAGAETPAEPPRRRAPPSPGTVQDGYRFKGGDPSKAQNWERL